MPTIWKKKEPRTGNPIDLTPEVEDKVIGQTILNKLYRPLVNSSNKIWRDLTQTKTPTLPFQIGEFLRYTNEVHNEMVEMVDINTNDPDRRE